MGAVSFSLDRRLVEHLKTALPLDTFVETGTFHGDTVAEMADLFDRLHSVELSGDLFERADRRFAGQAHIHLHHGESAQLLGKIRPELADGSVVFWLDAHWCAADATSGESSQCPLLDEIAALEQLNDQSVVLIDDARLYLCPPPEPHEVSQWPSLSDVLAALRTLSDRHEIMVVNDVIVFFPAAAKAALDRYARTLSIDWLTAAHHADHIDTLQRSIEVLQQALAERTQAVEELKQVISEKDRRIECGNQAAAEQKKILQRQRVAMESHRQTHDKQVEATETLRTKLQDVRERYKRQRDVARDHADELAAVQSALMTLPPNLRRRVTKLQQAGRQHISDRPAVMQTP